MFISKKKISITHHIKISVQTQKAQMMDVNVMRLLTEDMVRAEKKVSAKS